MSKEIAIKVDNVGKDFELPHERADSVKSLFTNPFRGKGRHKTEVQRALKDISFEIKKGEFFGIVGRNGSGKSTLLKIIAGIYQPTKGRVTVDGRLVPFIELGVGFNPELTGRENVYLNGALLGFSAKEVDAKYKKIVDFAELEKFMDQKLKNYSSGMQVRLGFSVATIMAESDILLIDEVLAVGDADFQRKCFNYFKTLKKNEKSVIFVTHDMQAVKEYCDRGILINDGNITSTGKPEKIANSYLKLFNKSKSGTEMVEENRWGTGGIVFSKLNFKAKDGYIKIETEIKAKESHENVTIGFRVSDAMGHVLVGTSNHALIPDTPIDIKAGEKKQYTFTTKDILGKGVYTFGATIQLADKVTVCDSWDGVATIRRLNSKTSYPLVMLPENSS